MKALKYQFKYALPLWFFQLICFLLPDNKYSIAIRGGLVSLLLPGRPKKFKLGRDVTLLNIDRLHIGENCYFAKGCWINAVGVIHVEKEVILSPYVVISSSKHTFKNGSVSQGGSFFSPVVIGSGSWVASNSTIAAGVQLGSGVLVGANSLVSQSFPDNKVILGVPAVVVKERIDRPGESFSAR